MIKLARLAVLTVLTILWFAFSLLCIAVDIVILPFRMMLPTEGEDMPKGALSTWRNL